MKPLKVYFDIMAEVISSKKTSSRVRFMLQDVIDLRRNKWVPRRDVAGPKTIQQIHEEVAKEKTMQQLSESVPSFPMSKMGSRDRDVGRGGGGIKDGRNRPRTAGQDDWLSIPSKAYTKPPERIDYSKISSISSNRKV